MDSSCTASALLGSSTMSYVQISDSVPPKASCKKGLPIISLRHAAIVFLYSESWASTCSDAVHSTSTTWSHMWRNSSAKAEPPYNRNTTTSAAATSSCVFDRSSFTVLQYAISSSGDVTSDRNSESSRNGCRVLSELGPPEMGRGMAAKGTDKSDIATKMASTCKPTTPPT